MDGMEITQFTYFQQAGGIELDPISVELTYGTRAAGDVPAGRPPRAGHAAGRRTSRWATCCSRTSARCLDLQLRARRHGRCTPATSTTSRRRRAAASRPACRCRPTTTCSSARTRSTCSTPAGRSRSPTGPAYILRMRRLTQAVAAAHLEVGGAPVPDLLVEIGCEELPAAPAAGRGGSSPGCFAAELDRAGTAARSASASTSPPAARGHRAYGLPASAAGGARARCAARAPTRPTRRGTGFARKHGLDAGSARASATASCGRYPRARRRRLAELVPAAIVGGRRGPPALRSRCAGAGGRFSRPDPLARREARRRGASPRGGRRAASGESRGPRPGREPVPIGSDARRYLDDLRAHGVIVDAGRAADGDRGRARRRRRLDDPMGKLDEVVYLVEWPRVLEGRVRRRAISSSPSGSWSPPCSRTSATSRSASGGRALEPRFLFVANGGDDDVVRRGNEEVLVGQARRRRVRLRARPRARPRGDGRRARPGQLPRGQSGRSPTRRPGSARSSSGSASGTTLGADVRAAAARAAAALCKADLVSRPRRASSRPRGLRRVGLRARAAGEPDEACAPRSRSTTARARRAASCPRADAGAVRRPGRQGRHARGRVRGSASSRPAAATRTACGGRRPGSWPSRSTGGCRVDLPSAGRRRRRRRSCSTGSSRSCSRRA